MSVDSSSEEASPSFNHQQKACDHSGWVFHPKYILSALLLSNSLWHFWVVPEGGSASRTRSTIHVSPPSWRGLLFWKHSLGESTPWSTDQRSLHGLQLSTDLPLSTPVQAPRGNTCISKQPRIQTLSDARTLKSNSFKTPVSWLRPNPSKPLSLVAMPGAREGGDSTAQSVQTATAPWGLPGVWQAQS